MSAYTYYASGSKSLSDIIASRKAGESKVLSSGGGPSYKVPTFVAPAITSDRFAEGLRNGESQRSFLASIPGWVSDTPISSKIPGLFIPPEQKANPVVLNPLMSFTIGSQYGIFMNVLNQTQSVSHEFREAVVKAASDQYLGNGSIPALLGRIKSQTPSRTSPPPTQSELDFLNKRFRVNLKCSLTKEDTILTLNPELNPDAHPGAPYFVSGVTVEEKVSEVLPEASNLVAIAHTKGLKGLRAYFSEEKNRMKDVMMLCPKRDVYDRKDYFRKTRPFFVGSLVKRIVYTALTSTLLNSLTNFVTDDESFSAFGFSWANGGAGRLVSWLFRPRAKPGLYALTWGDDQMWVVVCKDGSSFLLCPDVSGMDMKLDKSTFDLAQAHTLSQFSDTPFKLEWLRDPKAIRDWVGLPGTSLSPGWYEMWNEYYGYLRKQVVLATKHYTFQKDRGLPSGIPGTTYLDFVGSGRLVLKVQAIETPATSGADDIAPYLANVYSAAKELGFPLKEESMAYQPLTNAAGKRLVPHTIFRKQVTKCPSGTVIGLPFLGQTICTYEFPPELVDDGKARKIHIPVMDPMRVLVKTVYNVPMEKDPVKRAGAQMSALLGQGLNVFTNTQAFALLRETFEYELRANHHPIPREEPLVGFEDVGELVIAGEYPSPAVYAKILAPPDVRAVLTGVAMPKAYAVGGYEPPSGSLVDADENADFDAMSYFAGAPEAPVKEEPGEKSARKPSLKPQVKILSPPQPVTVKTEPPKEAGPSKVSKTRPPPVHASKPTPVATSKPPVPVKKLASTRSRDAAEVIEETIEEAEETEPSQLPPAEPLKAVSKEKASSAPASTEYRARKAAAETERMIAEMRKKRESFTKLPVAEKKNLRKLHPDDACYFDAPDFANAIEELEEELDRERAEAKKLFLAEEEADAREEEERKARAHLEEESEEAEAEGVFFHDASGEDEDPGDIFFDPTESSDNQGASAFLDSAPVRGVNKLK